MTVEEKNLIVKKLLNKKTGIKVIILIYKNIKLINILKKKLIIK